MKLIGVAHRDRASREKCERRRLRDHPDFVDGEHVSEWNLCKGCPACDAEYAYEDRMADLDSFGV